jgi:predicted nucleotide-binding protein
VILELGFFLGKLGREQVCSLYEDGVEIPSDYQGVLFLKLDKDGAWRLRLAKELKEAGLPIDLNDAI